jgi:hypothetical protein
MLAGYMAQFAFLLLLLKCLQQYDQLYITTRYLLSGMSQPCMVYITVFLQPNIRSNSDLIQIGAVKFKSGTRSFLVLLYQF